MSGEPIFYVGLHQPGNTQHFARSCVSRNRLLTRRKPLGGEVLIDSGAFTELFRHGAYREGVEPYAAQLYRLHTEGVAEIVAAVAQDYMCEPFIVAKTGLSVLEHQHLTIERYDALTAELGRLFGGDVPFHVMPVIQGFEPGDYARHIRMYGDRLKPEMWVGVGSVCKRNSTPGDVAAVLGTIAALRPDLRLHGFGLKRTAILDGTVRSLIYSADSMAWSFHARKNGRNANDWREAAAFVDAVTDASGRPSDGWQMPLPLEAAA